MNTMIKAVLSSGLLAAFTAPCQTASADTQGPLKSIFDRAEQVPAATYADLPYLAPQAPDGSVAISALALDIGGFGGGMLTGVGDGNDANGNSDRNLRVFSSIFGYWLVGYHTNASSGTYYGFVSAINSDGTPNTPFGTGGQLKAVVPFYPVDVAYQPLTSKFYFVGPYRASSTADYDFGVYCLDGSTGQPCSGFGNSGVGLSVTPVDSNGFHNDFPVKILYSSNTLYIIGTSDSAGGLANLDVSVAAIDSTLGSPLAGFGNNPDSPGTVVYGFDHTTNGVDRSTNLLVTSASSPGGHRLYVVGETQISTNGNDTDGFVLALDPATGQRDAGFASNGLRDVFADLGATNKEDEIDAIAQTRDGQIVMAGHSKDDDGNEQLLLAELDANGNYVSSFCGGGHCSGIRALTTYEVPVGISERTATRDLVVGMTIHDDFGAGADGHAMQAVLQFGRTGNPLHAIQVMDFAATDGATQDSSLADLLIDASDRVLAAGTRRWSSTTNDYDMTLTRMIDTDTIFANQFENVL